MALTNMSPVLFAALLCSAMFGTFVASDGGGPDFRHHSWWKECIEAAGIDLKDSKAAPYPFDKINGCIMQKYGMIAEDGKFSIVAAVERLRTVVKDEELLWKAEEAITKCEPQINSKAREPEEISMMYRECTSKLHIPPAKSTICYPPDVEPEPEHHQWRVDCYKEFGLEDKDRRSRDFPRNKVAGCMMRKSGQITAEGKFVLDVAVERLNRFLTNDDARERAIAALTDCEIDINTSARTEEEIVKMVTECLHKAVIPHPRIVVCYRDD